MTSTLPAVGNRAQLVFCRRLGLGWVWGFPDIARRTPEITKCCRITGEDCYFMRLHLRSTDDLEPILDRFVAHGRTTTSFVHSAPVPSRPLPAGPLDQPPAE